jgi:hypothetical protein
MGFSSCVKKNIFNKRFIDRLVKYYRSWIKRSSNLIKLDYFNYISINKFSFIFIFISKEKLGDWLFCILVVVHLPSSIQILQYPFICFMVIVALIILIIFQLNFKVWSSEVDSQQQYRMIFLIFTASDNFHIQLQAFQVSEVHNISK